MIEITLVSDQTLSKSKDQCIKVDPTEKMLFDEGNLSEIDFRNTLESTLIFKESRELRSEWLEKLGISTEKAKEIDKSHSRMLEIGTELEKINSWALLASLTQNAKNYSDGVDSILLKTLVKPECLDERVALCVWRHILKANEVFSPKEEWQKNRNQELLAKIAEINGLLRLQNISQQNVGSSTGNTESQQTNIIKTKARQIGEEWMNKERADGNDPGVTEIAKYVEGELSNQNITGPRGKFWDWETVKREALKGITGKAPNGKGKKNGKTPGNPQYKNQFPSRKPSNSKGYSSF